VAPRHWCRVCALLDYTFDLVFRAIPGKVVPSLNTNSTRHPEFLSSSPRTTKSQCYDVLYECNTQSQQFASRSTPAPHFSKRLTDWTHRLNGLFKIFSCIDNGETIARAIQDSTALAISVVWRTKTHMARRPWLLKELARLDVSAQTMLFPVPQSIKARIEVNCRYCPGSFFGL